MCVVYGGAFVYVCVVNVCMCVYHGVRAREGFFFS